ncbi:pancreatic triacylglycerol lipase [Cephus cinctus]|uniref:phospholipase A1 n=1 Tax=Cephus cinctus TaxID=211228 RepID=A0AAJ7BG50_CEPCN|nr:pancreatic triacylglycerol lipase [Cephus cinctus]XP_015585266.1 pancreatic triacylglycerol lipase [Cephus cinctus]XP_015585267.1 pancreatic triacylglycerol lipase [Cephus cinctus]XP_015585268.1 pancreatic triacylglycerol lipase [Cephus cinctus]XP_024936073.1 pancreatic triacylglycerol lipase [Cephus cinctus]
MKNSIALLLLLAVTIRGFPNTSDKNDVEDDTSTQQLAVEDDDGNLVPLDLDAKDTNDTELSSESLNDSVLFYLYTVKNPNDFQQLWINDSKTLSESNFDPSKPTRIVTHGWKNSYKGESCVLIREAYLKHRQYNVIVVDWSKISVNLYTVAMSGVKKVAAQVGQMIDFLATQGVDTTTTIVIGHSLGAHVAGIAARQAKSTVDYVVALDPALPLFAFAEPGDRVAKGDANFVQVIHTNLGRLGFDRAIGDVDFFPNGGGIQPGCGVNWSCSHGRSYKYFAESINSNIGFVGIECENFILYKLDKCRDNNKEIMGGPNPTTKATKKYYLDTNESSPYAKG